MSAYQITVRHLSAYTGIPTKRITSSSELHSDLAMDDIDILDAVTEIEREVNLEIPDDQVRSFHTVSDIVGWLSSRL